MGWGGVGWGGVGWIDRERERVMRAWRRVGWARGWAPRAKPRGAYDGNRGREEQRRDVRECRPSPGVPRGPRQVARAGCWAEACGSALGRGSVAAMGAAHRGCNAQRGERPWWPDCGTASQLWHRPPPCDACTHAERPEVRLGAVAARARHRLGRDVLGRAAERPAALPRAQVAALLGARGREAHVHVRAADWASLHLLEAPPVYGFSRGMARREG